MRMKTSIVAAAIAIISGAAHAQTVAEFYKGKNLSLLVGSDIGGGYDVYSRTLARHWGKRIPGNPSIVVQNMPGANGVTMMNHLVNAAPRDGSVVGAAFGADLTDPLIDQGTYTKYDPREVAWIGNIAPQYNTCFVGKNSKIKTLDDAMKNETQVAAGGANSNAAVTANVYNTLIGTKFKPIMGYASNALILAIERGETDGTCLSYDTLVASQPDAVARGAFNWLIVLNDKPIAELPGTPAATQFARTEEERQSLELLIARNLMGRPYVVAKQVPADRLEALRSSFFETLKDPVYLEEAKAQKMTVSPADHVAMEKMIEGVYKIPPHIVQRVIDLTK